ncbi:hypothetical protein RQP46_008345 [Phenoliferia psychrophenolica]
MSNQQPTLVQRELKKASNLVQQDATAVGSIALEAVQSGAYIYPIRGIYYFLSHPKLFESVKPIIIKSITMSATVLSLMTFFTYLPQVAFLALVSGPLAFIGAAAAVLAESWIIITFLNKTFLVKDASEKVFDAVLAQRGYSDLVEKGRTVHKSGGGLVLGKSLLQPIRSKFSTEGLVRYVMTLPLNAIPAVGTVFFLGYNGQHAGPTYHNRYFQLKGFSSAERNTFVQKRRGAYTSKLRMPKYQGDDDGREPRRQMAGIATKNDWKIIKPQCMAILDKLRKETAARAVVSRHTQRRNLIRPLYDAFLMEAQANLVTAFSSLDTFMDLPSVAALWVPEFSAINEGTADPFDYHTFIRAHAVELFQDMEALSSSYERQILDMVGQAHAAAKDVDAPTSGRHGCGELHTYPTILKHLRDEHESRWGAAGWSINKVSTSPDQIRAIRTVLHVLGMSEEEATKAQLDQLGASLHCSEGLCSGGPGRTWNQMVEHVAMRGHSSLWVACELDVA